MGRQDRPSLQRMVDFVKFFTTQAGHGGLAIRGQDILYVLTNFDQHLDLTMQLYLQLSEYVDCADLKSPYMMMVGGSPAVVVGLIGQMEPPLHTYSLESRLNMALDRRWTYRGCHIVSGLNARLGCELTDSNVLDVVFFRQLWILESNDWALRSRLCAWRQHGEGTLGHSPEVRC